MQALSNITNAKIIYDIAKAFSHYSISQDYLGKASQIYTKKNTLHEKFYGYSNFIKNNDHTLMYVQSLNDTGIITLCLHGDSKELLQRQKLSLMKIIKLNWNIHLEQEVVKLDKQISNQLQKQQFKHTNEGSITKYRLETIKMQRYIQENSIKYTKIYFVLSDTHKADL